MNEKEFRETFAKFQVMIATKNAQVMSNPLPHLQAMEERCSHLLQVLEKVEYALSPDIVFDKATSMGIEPIDFQGEALLRCNEALKILLDYKRGKFKS